MSTTKPKASTTRNFKTSPDLTHMAGFEHLLNNQKVNDFISGNVSGNDSNKTVSNVTEKSVETEVTEKETITKENSFVINDTLLKGVQGSELENGLIDEQKLEDYESVIDSIVSKEDAVPLNEVKHKETEKLVKQYPWMEESDAKTQHITRLPNQLKQMLDFLGQTTYGETMTSICTEGISRVVIEMMEERNLPIPSNAKDWRID